MKDFLNNVVYGSNRAFDSLKNTASSMFTQTPQQTQLKHRLSTCIYPQINKTCVIKAILRLQQTYNLQYGTILINMNGRPGQYVQLTGNIPVNYKGATYPVLIKLMFPEYFPNQPPMIRVINIDPQRYTVIEEWKGLQSPVDPTSYPLNFLGKNWNATLDAAMVVMEAQQLMGQKFPFRTKHSTNMTSSVQAPSFASNPINISKPNNPHPIKPSTPPHQSPNSPPHPPIKTIPSSEVHKHLSTLCSNTSQLALTLTKDTELLHKNYLSTFQSTQRLDQTNKCLLEQTQYLKQQSQKLSNYLHQADQLTQIDLKTTVIPIDDKSANLLELLAHKRALQSVIQIVEGKFKDGEIDLEMFIKLVRKYEEERFQVVVVMRKVLGM